MPFTFLGEMLNWLFLEILDLKLELIFTSITAASLDVKDLFVISLKPKMLRFYISTWDYSLSNARSSQKAVWGLLAERILVCLGDLNLYNFTSTLPLLM